MFDSLTYDKLIEGQAAEADNIMTILKTVPIPLGKCITVGQESNYGKIIRNPKGNRSYI